MRPSLKGCENKVSMLAYELVQIIMIQEDYIINKIICINHFCFYYINLSSGKRDSTCLLYIF